MADAFFSTSWRILEPHGCATVIGSVQPVDDWVIEYVVKRLARKDVVRCRSCRRRIGPPQADNLVDLQLGIPSPLGATFRRNFCETASVLAHECAADDRRLRNLLREIGCRTGTLARIIDHCAPRQGRFVLHPRGQAATASSALATGPPHTG